MSRHRFLWGHRRRHNRASALSRQRGPWFFDLQPNPYYGFPTAPLFGNPPLHYSPFPFLRGYSRRDWRRIESGILPPTSIGAGVPSVPWTGTLHVPWLHAWCGVTQYPSSWPFVSTYGYRTDCYPTHGVVAIFRYRWPNIALPYYHPLRTWPR